MGTLNILEREQVEPDASHDITQKQKRVMVMVKPKKEARSLPL